MIFSSMVRWPQKQRRPWGGDARTLTAFGGSRGSDGRECVCVNRVCLCEETLCLWVELHACASKCYSALQTGPDTHWLLFPVAQYLLTRCEENKSTSQIWKKEISARTNKISKYFLWKRCRAKLEVGPVSCHSLECVALISWLRRTLLFCCFCFSAEFYPKLIVFWEQSGPNTCFHFAETDHQTAGGDTQSRKKTGKKKGLDVTDVFWWVTSWITAVLQNFHLN